MRLATTRNMAASKKKRGAVSQKACHHPPIMRMDHPTVQPLEVMSTLFNYDHTLRGIGSQASHDDLAPRLCSMTSAR